MELSERERRLLQEMESHLLAEDPGLATSLSVHRLRVGARVLLAVSGLAVGVLLMAVGVGKAHAVGIAVALVGYLVILAATTAAIECLPARGDRRRAPWAAKRAGRAS